MFGGSYLVRRVFFALLVVWAASSLIFFLPRLIHQNALEERFSDDGARVSDTRRAANVQFQERFGFNRPLWSQYASHLWRLARFDLGYSMSYYPVTVKEILKESAAWTIGLVAFTTVVAFGAGTVMGGLLAWPASPRWLKLSFLPFVTLSAMPYYLIALMLVFIVAFRLGWFPIAGGNSLGTLPEPSLKFAADVVLHGFLPAMSIILAATGAWALQARGMLVTVMGDDFITLAESKGLRRRRLFLRYALRNALLPQVTGLAVSLSTIVSGVVLVEVIFRYPGIGETLYWAIRRGDYFVISGLVYVVIITLAIALLLIDLAYPRIDPRIRRQF